METLPREFILNIEGKADETIEDIICNDGRTLGEFVCDGLNLYVTVADLQAQGARLLVEKGGRVKELVTNI